MLVVHNDSLDTLSEIDETADTTTSELLEVQHPIRYRRKSSGNIARDLGTTVELLGLSHRRSSGSTG
jgi:hypothetical protein